MSGQAYYPRLNRRSREQADAELGTRHTQPPCCYRQCTAQQQFSQEHSTKTDFLIILRDAVPVGRLSVARWQDESRLVDMALLPPYRNTGIGTAILRDLLAEAAVAHKPVRIHVEKFNPALRLYERLGLAPIEDKGVYLFLEWAP